jgi:two-component system, NarL family, sensor histidine kinase UhpB
VRADPATQSDARGVLARPRRYLPLFHRVAGINAVLLIAAVALTILVLVPGHESSVHVGEEGIVLAGALLLVVLLNLYLLRRIVRPVQQLTAVARTVDLADARPRMPHGSPTSEAGELAMTFNAMLARLQAERLEATGRVLAAQESERLRIAQELHDQVGQELTAVLLLLSRVVSHAPDELRASVVEAQSAVRSSLEDVRQIAIELRPEALDDLGLESAISVLCGRFAERSGLEVSCRVAEQLPQLSPDLELVIYRVAQEALTNAVRHSGSDQVELALERRDGTVLLTVRDYGRGLGRDDVPGSGVRGMRERAGLIGAELEIGNVSTGGGCEVRLDVPVEVAA